MKMIPHAALFSALFLFVHSYGAATGGLSSSQQNPQTPQSVGVLAPGGPIERELAGAEAHAYRVTLAPQQFLLVLINQKGVDVVVRCFGPDARQIAEVNNTTGPQGSERLSLVAEAAGDYLLEVRPVRKEAARGRYDVRVEELREATPRDLSLVAAGRAYAEGMNLSRQPTDESLRSAIKKFEEALRLYRAAGEREQEFHSLTNSGLAYRMLGDNRSASNIYLESLSIARSIDNRLLQATALINLGGAYSEMGEAEKSIDSLDQALELSLAAGDLQRQASAHINIGVAYSLIGEPQRAMEHLSRVMAIHQATGNNRAKSMTGANLASTYLTLGEYEKALAGYQEVLSILRAANYSRGVASMLGNIGVTHLHMGDSRKAMEVLDEALTLSRSSGERMTEIQALGGLGDAHCDLGELPEALEKYNQKLIIARDLGLRIDEATTLLQIGAVYELTGEEPKALEYLNQALSLSRSIKSREIEALALYHMARVEKNLDRLAEARALIEAALGITESQRTRVASHDMRVSYLASKRKFYEFHIDTLMRLRQSYPSKGYEAMAFEASEKARARSLLEMLVESRSDIRQGVDPLLLARERQLRRSLNARERYRMQLIGGKSDEERLATVEKELANLLSEYQQVEAQIRQNSPRYAALTQPRTLSVAEIQQQLLDDDTLLIEYALGAERSYMWVVTKDDLISSELPKRDEIEASARRVYDLLTARNQQAQDETLRQRSERIAKADADYERSAAALSQTLLGPAAAQLARSGKKRLLIVGDGALQYIPFSALPLPTTGRKGETRRGGDRGTERQNKSAIRNPQSAIRNPLISAYDVVNLPSASTLAVLRQGAGGLQSTENLLAVLADPVFEAGDPRVKAQRASQDGRPSPAPVETTPLTEAVERSAPESGVNRFLRLRFTREEAEAIASFAPAGRKFSALDFAASRATVNQTDLSGFRYVHFATHGLLNSRRPELSGIVLSLVDEQGQPQDGFLRLHEIYNLKLNADLVVLSGCRTALGKEIKGEGLIGLTRGFMHAGAKSVMASLWGIEDRATAELMKRFYSGMLGEGLSPSAALCAAQRGMLKGKYRAQPYYWAAFTLQGEWK